MTGIDEVDSGAYTDHASEPPETGVETGRAAAGGATHPASMLPTNIAANIPDKNFFMSLTPNHL
jgi:hypothetical protein